MKKFFQTISVGAFAVNTLAFADGPVRSWKPNNVDDNYGNTALPPNLGEVRSISASNHTLAIRSDGTVFAWGNNDNGQATPPADLGKCIQVATQTFASCAIRESGQVVTWGWPNGGGNLPPVNLGPCVAISGGESFFAAIKANGTVVSWGSNAGTVPASLGECVEVAAGSYHVLAIRRDGTVGAFGVLDYGQIAVPPALGTCLHVAAGSGHSVALRTDGSILAWGSNWHGECTVPADIGPCKEIAARGSRTAALTLNGSVRIWGYSAEYLVPPVDLVESTKIALGFGHVAVQTVNDCDSNGVRDAEEMVGHDCNGNGVVDACDATRFILEDCNSNGLGDTCEKELTVSLESGHLGPIGYLSNQTWTIPSAVRTESPVTLRIHGHGDFGGLQEFVRVKVGYGFEEHAIQNTNDCEIGGMPSRALFTIAPEVFNSAIGADGALRVVFEPSIAVDPTYCPSGTWIEASLDYIGARPSDCNANGMLDSCEIAEGYSPDHNHNGVVDTCESLILPCPSDFDQNGRTDGADLGILLSAWGVSGQPGVDLDHNGRIDGADLGILLSGWGTCAN